MPELSVLELPFLFESFDEADYTLDNHLFQPVSDAVSRQGFVMYQWAENGWQSFGSTFGPVKSPADLKGKKWRVQDSKVHWKIYEAFGASPNFLGYRPILEPVPKN